MKCPICSEPMPEIEMKTYDDRYGYPGLFTLMKCHRCEHQFLDCNLTAGELTDLYTNYYPRKSLDLSTYLPHKEQTGFYAWINGLGSSAFRWVPCNVRVLDVGCGFGQSLGYHTVRGCDVYGVEADENISRVVEKFGFKVHIGLFDDTVYSREFFDYITMDQVIEHVTDPITTLRGVSRILKPSGTVILSTPNARSMGARLFGKRWINWHIPYHQQFFTRESMRLAAAKAGLVVTEVKMKTSSQWLLYQWIHLVTYPEQGQPSWFWSPIKSSARLHHKIIVRVLMVLHKIKINHCITRILDGLDLGDNLLFFLKKQ